MIFGLIFKYTKNNNNTNSIVERSNQFLSNSYTSPLIMMKYLAYLALYFIYIIASSGILVVIWFISNFSSKSARVLFNQPNFPPVAHYNEMLRILLKRLWSSKMQDFAVANQGTTSRFISPPLGGIRCREWNRKQISLKTLKGAKIQWHWFYIQDSDQSRAEQ